MQLCDKDENYCRSNPTCLPHFQSGPRITRAPTPSIMNLIVLVVDTAPESILRDSA